MQDQGSALNADARAATQTQRLVACVDNEGYRASLEKRKMYLAPTDTAAEQHGLVPVR